MSKLPEERRRSGESPTVRVTTSTLPNLIKDGGYKNITNTNKVSPTQITPALQATLRRPLGVRLSRIHFSPTDRGGEMNA